VLETSARLLRLLGLLQTHRDWTGTDLSDRLGVSTRTIRTDVERLRMLGYPVEAKPGVAGGYRLGAGASLPPLLLDDDEAIAVALGLRAAAGGSVAGIEEISLEALAKLEQLLPSRLRHRVEMMQAATVTVAGAGGPTVDIDVLTAIAAAIRATARLRFDYVNYDGDETRRDVEPHRLVNWGRRWYLVAWDHDRADWRTFRVDRLTPIVPTGPRFAPRELPEEDVATFVQRGAGSATWRTRARVLVHAPAEQVRPKLPPAVHVEPAGDNRCLVEVGSDTPEILAIYICMLDVDFVVIDGPELAAVLEQMAARLLRAARS
jgi:predicted DNA-binding transcriptional regulator YafY